MDDSNDTMPLQKNFTFPKAPPSFLERAGMSSTKKKPRVRMKTPRAVNALIFDINFQSAAKLFVEAPFAT